MRINAFRALRPAPELAERIAAVPYDTVDTAEARALAEGNPHSFLRISRAEIESPPGTDPHSDSVYSKAAENLARFTKESILSPEDAPCLYIYRLKAGSHSQRGIAACCHVGDYNSDVIKKHEKTRPDKEDDRTRHIEILNAQTGPILMTYRDNAEVDRLVAEIEADAPLFDFIAPDGIRHTVWRVEAHAPLVKAFANVPACYIADGHHRAAAAARFAATRRAANPKHTGKEEYNWFLAVLFPSSQLRIMPYNRCVADLNELDKRQFLDAARKVCELTDNAAPAPDAPRGASMYLDGKWYGLKWPARGAGRKLDPVAALDVSLLQDTVLGPILGINDPRTDKRIEFIGGIRGTGELAHRVDSGNAAVAFAMHPVGVDQMMAIADAGRIMPPKSTWFEPKLRSGLFIHTL